MATKGQKFKQWTPEEKYKLIEPLLTMEKGQKYIQEKSESIQDYFLLGLKNIEKKVWKD